MAKFGIAGDTSGVITVQGPSVAGTNTLTWPAETGTVVTTASTTVPNTIAWNTTVQTTGFTAVAYGGYFCNTTGGAFTVTLPATPTRGQFVVIVDYAGTSATNNITVSGNGAKINGSGASATLATNRQGITYTYIDSTQGWLASSNVYGGNPPFTQTYTVTYLIAAGGGGGGGGTYSGAGGGAGGLLTGTFTATASSVYTITVGGSGSAGVAGGSPGNGGNGGNSSISPAVATSAIGGGYGGQGTSPASGGNGGSGGGATGSVGTGGTGTPGQGNNGGVGNGSSPYAGGGGGGSGGVGGNGNASPNGGPGGSGTASSITGTPATYTVGGTGGQGRFTPANNGAAGGANTGNGGGGGGGPGSAIAGGAGGSGVVIISVPTSSYSGITTGSPTVTTSGSNTILKYTASGTYTA